jgi:hypothetical protein
VWVIRGIQWMMVHWWGLLVHCGLEKAEIQYFHSLSDYVQKRVFWKQTFWSPLWLMWGWGFWQQLYTQLWMNLIWFCFLFGSFFPLLKNFPFACNFVLLCVAKYFIHYMDDVSSSNNRVLFSLLKPKISAFFWGALAWCWGLLLFPKEKRLLKLKI